EEFGRHHRADRVAAQVLGAGAAAAVPVESGERIGSTRFELAAEHVTVAHGCSIRSAPIRRKITRGGPRPDPEAPAAWTASGRPLSLDCMVSQDFRVRTTPPVPLDRGELELSLRPLGQSRMLPRAAYVDPAVFEWEQRHFFGGGWMCVARSEQLPQPGDQRAEATGQGGVLLVRGEDGEVRAFANSC